MKRVLLEGAFYSPYSSEGRWAFNITRLLSKIEGIELYVLVPDLARQHVYFKDFDLAQWFPNTKVVDINTKIDFDIFFIIQGDDPRLTIKAKKRVLGIFEAYWYGDVPESRGFSTDTIVCYGLQPYRQVHPHNNWPKKYRLVHLPYSPYYKPDSNNFEQKGILLTIKDPASPDYTREIIEARLDHLRAAIHFLKQNIKVSVSMTHRLDLELNPAYRITLSNLLDELRNYGAIFLDKLMPPDMEKVISEHSILYTGKVGEIMLYAAFNDALCLGSLPLIHSDWPEQFFKNDIFTGYQGIDNLLATTSRLLVDENQYSGRLDLLRSNIELCTEQQGIEILKGLIE